MTQKSNIPQGKLSRGAVVGATAAKVGAKKAAHLGRRPFLTDASRQQADSENDEAIAKIIFNALCLLRGTALKAAQVVAMKIDWLPEAYQKELIKAASQVSPMNRALVRKAVSVELGPPEKVFESFDLLPFAAASLGQVHKAVTHDGKNLAVKVQYPGMAEGVKADIDMLKSVLAPTKYSRVFKACFPEMQQKVNEELDYQKEAARTRYFKEQVRDKRFVLPDIYKEYSTKRVLATTRIQGLHLTDWLKTKPSKKMRNHFGQLLVDFFNHAMFSLHTIHADPNPGNFLFRDDGKLGVIDFGCTTTLTPEFVQAINNLLKVNDNTKATVEEQLHKTVGIHYRQSAEDEQFASFLTEWVKWIKEPYQESGYDFEQNTDYFQRGTAFFNTFRKYIDHYDGCFLYYGRTSQGLLRLLQQLGAKVNLLPRF